MELATQRDIARRTFRFLDEGTTEMAAGLYEEPLDAYISRDVWQREIDLLFRSRPLFVGMGRDLPEPGSYFLREIVGTPLIITRDEGGTVHAFLNACRHRSVKVTQEPCGITRRLTCPFHAWTYNLAGELVGVPFAPGFEGFPREGNGLVELPAIEVHGLLFARLTQGDPIDAEEFLGGLNVDFAQFGFETWTPIAEPHVHRVKANWKTVYDGFCETYHFLSLHRDTAPHVHGNVSVFDAIGRHGRMTTTNKLIDDFRDVPEDDWYPLRDGFFNVNYRVFPNLAFSTIGLDRTEIFSVLPGAGPDETIAVHFSYLRHAPETEEARVKALADLDFTCTTIVDNQDFRVNETTLPGIHHPDAPSTFVFGCNEPCAQHYHRQINEVFAAG